MWGFGAGFAGAGGAGGGRGLGAAALLAASAASLLLAGCLPSKQEAPSSGTTTVVTGGATTGGAATAGSTAATGKTFKIGFAQANSQDPWRQVQNASLKSAVLKYPDLSLEIADAHQDSNAQIGQIENFVTNKVDLLMVSANEAAPLTPKVGEVYDKKIPVILMERAINSDQYTTLISGDNREIGKEAGEFMVAALKGKGKYVEIEGVADATPTKDRSGGFHSVVDQAAGLKRVDAYVCNYKRDQAIKYMQNLLQTRKPFDAVFAHNDEMALGAMIAMKNAGRDPRKVVIVGIDGVQKEAIQAIEAGEMSATFKYPWLGEEAMKAAHDVFTGKSMPKKILLPTEKVTKANAADYLSRLPKT